MKENNMLEIAKAVLARTVSVADAALSARESGDTMSEDRYQDLCDSLCNVAHRAAISYCDLGGEWESRAVALLQGADTYHSMTMGRP